MTVDRATTTDPLEAPRKAVEEAYGHLSYAQGFVASKAGSIDGEPIPGCAEIAADLERIATELREIHARLN